MREGDTLGSIADEFGITWQEIDAVNEMENPNVLSIGQEIEIPQDAPVVLNSDGTVRPGERTHIVVEGDTLLDIAIQYGKTLDEVLQANNITAANLIQVGQELIIPPEEEVTPLARPKTPSHRLRGKLWISTIPADRASSVGHMAAPARSWLFAPKARRKATMWVSSVRCHLVGYSARHLLVVSPAHRHHPSPDRQRPRAGRQHGRRVVSAGLAPHSSNHHPGLRSACRHRGRVYPQEASALGHLPRPSSRT